MRIIFSLSTALGLLGLSIGAPAEGNCPSGFYPIGNGAIAACVLIPGGTERGQQGSRQDHSVPIERWADRFGSIASDADRGVYESVGDMVGISAAEHAALANCKAKGRRKCEILLTYHNGCAALVFGDTVYLAQTGPTVETANKKALQQCSAATNNCRVAFNACSLPVLFNDFVGKRGQQSV